MAHTATIESPAPELSTFDRLYQALDGLPLRASHDWWHVRLYSVMDEGDERWIQASLIGEPSYSVLLHLRPGCDATDSVRCIQEWLRRSAAWRRRVIEVRPYQPAPASRVA